MSWSSTPPPRPAGVPYYPVGIDLHDQPVLLVGGGKIAEGKVEALLDCGARVTLVSPDVTGPVRQHADAGRLVWHRRPFVESDVAGAWIVIAATDDRAVNAAVADAARAAGRLVNAVDDVPNCDFIAMSVIRRGDLQVAISTGGASPAMARWVREEFESLVPEEFGPLLDLLGEIRANLKAHGRVPPYETWRRAISPEVLRLLAAGHRDAARFLLLAVLAPPGLDTGASRSDASPTPGTVYLVGAGPGAPGLLTLRGRECLAQADAVVYDHLVDRGILALAAPDARLIYAGKEPGHHSVPQEQTNALLVELARAGQTVVRLKGGDPFVFGRGGEEAHALAESGIRFEIVPGVSSAVAVPAYAGIPITHRDHAAAVTIVTGHENPATSSKVDWDALARSGATLVILMGMTNLPAIVERLALGRRPDDTPVAVIQNGTRADQRTVTGSLADIVERVAAARVASPAVIVVGDVVRVRDQIAWFIEEPRDAADSGPIAEQAPDRKLVAVGS